ncbi:hypothetical protein FRX31_019980 [Thalictrum thalictroides]|uniref:Uncharacterized protein n=1 Tax=Thalictrum thalictroides TaxID=46969 RepID=A0A7J6VZ92_THATH|nr:hypothetical protein FRX31_019980 [Thalictrum thalictroides]
MDKTPDLEMGYCSSSSTHSDFKITGLDFPCFDGGAETRYVKLKFKGSSTAQSFSEIRLAEAALLMGIGAIANENFSDIKNSYGATTSTPWYENWHSKFIGYDSEINYKKRSGTIVTNRLSRAHLVQGIQHTGDLGLIGAAATLRFFGKHPLGAIFSNALSDIFKLLEDLVVQLVGVQEVVANYDIQCLYNATTHSSAWKNVQIIVSSRQMVRYKEEDILKDLGECRHYSSHRQRSIEQGDMNPLEKENDIYRRSIPSLHIRLIHHWGNDAAQKFMHSHFQRRSIPSLHD